MDPFSIRKLADAWVKLQAAKPDDLELDPNFWAHGLLWRLTQESPDDAWLVILGIMECELNELAMGSLAAGPLEDLLSYQGGSVIELIEARAHKDPVFRKILRGVWRNNIAEEVWKRVQTAAHAAEH